MTVQITIRNVPNEVRDELAARAALERRSMQEFLLLELERIARRPTIEQWLAQIRERKHITQRQISAADILRYRDTDRQ